MEEINLIFYTDSHHDGYQLGIDLILNKSLSPDEYNNLCAKISFIFKSINYGMDILKINETLKTILSFSGIDETNVARAEITIVNKKYEEASNTIIGVKQDSLANRFYMYALERDRETLSNVFESGKITYYSYQNSKNEFTYSNNQASIKCDSLSEDSRKRNAFINKFFKNNLAAIKELEKVSVPDIYSDLNVNDSILITAYKLFYNEMPDFNDPNIILKMQCMVAILHINVWRLFPSNSKHNYQNPGISTPESEYVRDQLFKLNLLLGNDLSEIEDFNFKEFFSKKIKLVGETIRTYMSSLPSQERIMFLNKFAVDYISDYYGTNNKINNQSKELMLFLTKNNDKN